MNELIVFPDVVDMVVDALSQWLALPRPDVAVHAEVPNPRPDKFVTIERVGGTRRNLVVDEALITIEAWSTRADDAQTIGQLAKAIVHRMAGHVWLDSMVYRVDEAGGLQHSPDPTSGGERYMCTVQVAVRGRVVEFLSAEAGIAAQAAPSGA